MLNLAFKRSADTQTKQGSIGLEFARDSVHLVQLNKNNSDGSISVNASCSLAYHQELDNYIYDAAQLRELLKPAFKNAPFSGKRVVTVMPSSEISILSLNYELKPGANEQAAVAAALQDRIEGNLADYVIDMVPVRRREDQNSALAIVALAKKDKVLAYLECLRKAGFTVEALEIGPAAIQRLVAAMRNPEDGETVLTINFGRDKSFLSIISGRRLLFDEGLQFGEDLLLNALSDALQMDREMICQQIEQHGLGQKGPVSVANADIGQTMAHIVKRHFIQLAENIERALLYAVAESRGTPVSKIYMVGSLARWQGADAMLSGLLSMPVEVIPDPLAQFAANDTTTTQLQGDSASGHAPELAVATGLALRGMLQDG